MLDLTKITTPFGLLDKATQLALRVHCDGGGEIEYFTGKDWFICREPFFCGDVTYRAQPKPTVIKARYGAAKVWSDGYLPSISATNFGADHWRIMTGEIVVGDDGWPVSITLTREVQNDTPPHHHHLRSHADQACRERPGGMDQRRYLHPHNANDERGSEEMTDNTITISLDDVLGPDGLEGAWEGMVQKLSERAESRFLHSDAGTSFHAAAVEAINNAVSSKISDKISDLMARPMQKTDGYGNPVGEPLTFDAMIGQAVERAMETTVDLYGQPRPGKPSGMFDMTLFEYSLQRVALAGIEKAVIAEAKKVNESAKAAVGKEVAKAIAKAIK